MLKYKTTLHTIQKYIHTTAISTLNPIQLKTIEFIIEKINRKPDNEHIFMSLYILSG